MYPSTELTALAARKAALRGRIAASRFRALAHGAAVARPLARIDAVVRRWQRIPPAAKVAAIPLLLALGRRIFPRHTRALRRTLRWLPVMTDLARTLAVTRFP